MIYDVVEPTGVVMTDSLPKSLLAVLLTLGVILVIGGFITLFVVDTKRYRQEGKNHKSFVAFSYALVVLGFIAAMSPAVLSQLNPNKDIERLSIAYDVNLPSFNLPKEGQIVWLNNVNSVDGDVVYPLLGVRRSGQTLTVVTPHEYKDGISLAPEDLVTLPQSS